MARSFSRRPLLLAGAAVFSLLFAAGLPIIGAKAQDQAQEPKAIIADFYTTLLDVMKDAQALGFDGRYAKLAPAIDATFDVTVMAKIAVGSDWTQMPGEKKAALLDVFRQYMIATYASRFKGFSGEHFEVDTQKQTMNDRVLVESRLVKSSGEPVQLNYVFRKNTEGAWKVIDIYLGGTISEMARMRSDFLAILQQGGADALIASLEGKIAEMKKAI